MKRRTLSPFLFPVSSRRVPLFFGSEIYFRGAFSEGTRSCSLATFPPSVYASLYDVAQKFGPFILFLSTRFTFRSSSTSRLQFSSAHPSCLDGAAQTLSLSLEVNTFEAPTTKTHMTEKSAAAAAPAPSAPNEPISIVAPATDLGITSPRNGGSPDVEGLRIDLVWKNVSVDTTTGRRLLDNVSGQISSGLVAIMGPSGSGKTTLLNCLACRMDAGVIVSEGELRINGQSYSSSSLKRYLGYVMQDDLHSPLLTSRETLTLAADTRLASKMNKYLREALVDRIMQQLSLTHCADVLVGTGRDGLSAGERKRLSVALELLSMPKMLFLDEPTSNLDSLDALQFVQSLRNLIDQTGCVIVCTIHQPQFKVFRTFDRLIMLRSGDIVYDDTVAKVQDYCVTMGDPCPPDANPADHLMSIIAPNLNDSFHTELRKKSEFHRHYEMPDVDPNRGAHRLALYLRDEATWSDLMKAGYRRSFILLKRRFPEWRINLIVNVVNAVLVGTVFLQIGTTTASVEKRLPALFFVVVNQGTFGAISTVNLFPSERSIILRQRAAGNVAAFPYFFTKATAEMLWKLPFPILFSIVTYFLIGFQPTAERFFAFLAAVVLSFLTGMAVAMAVGAVSRAADIASLSLPFIMELSRLFAGFFLPMSEQHIGLQWLDYLSYYFYGFAAAAHNEMDNLLITDCVQAALPVATGNASSNVSTSLATITKTATQTVCTSYPANRQLAQRGMTFSYANSMGTLACYFVIFLIVTYLAVRFIKW